MALLSSRDLRRLLVGLEAPWGRMPRHDVTKGHPMRSGELGGPNDPRDIRSTLPGRIDARANVPLPEGDVCAGWPPNATVRLGATARGRPSAPDRLAQGCRKGTFRPRFAIQAGWWCVLS
jgi:hypothetical protein